jgi:carboxypeptidase Q
MYKLFIITLFVMNVLRSEAQNIDSLLIKKIYEEALTDNSAIQNLKYLTKNIGGRICASPQAAAAVEWSEQLLIGMGIDSVYLQKLKVVNWKRGEIETGSITSTIFGNINITICALGTSVGTGENGIFSEVIEVKSINELKELGESVVKGKIVFFNRPMNPASYSTFEAYGGAVDQRVIGASEAAKYGAIGIVIRSLTLSTDEFPHTGVMRYKDENNRIPAVAICTKHADILSKWLKSDPKLKLYYRTTCNFFPEAESFNVVGEISGSDFPDEIITVGGHLDSWDIGEGAHDDGAGCIQAIEVLRIFKRLNIKPKHTLRVVLFMDEEIAQRGAKKYAEMVVANNEKHLFALESDNGADLPIGFSIDAEDSKFNEIAKLKKYFAPYKLFDFIRGGTGVDISPLKKSKIPLIALISQSQRYFDYHHCANDTFENVNKRELQLGSASIAAIVYLLDIKGL